MTSAPDRYPNAPGFKTYGPSEQAAAAMTGPAKTIRDQVLKVVASAPRGLTADEIARHLNRSILSVRPRVSELNRQGKIRQSGARGRNESGMTAAVWVLSTARTMEDTHG